MKQFVLVFALTFGFFSVIGQTYHPFVDTGNVWSTYHLYCKSADAHAFSEFTKFEKDTLIDGREYKKVWSSLDSNMSNWEQSAFIREDAEKKVFLRYPNSEWEETIYNFGASAGDTIGLHEQPYGPMLYTVDSVNWVTMLDGKQRQQFFLHSNLYTDCNEVWIEGMGCTKGVFGGGTCGYVGDNPALICFSQNDTLLWFNPDFDQCYVVTGINDPGKNSSEIILFPNPANETLTISLRKPGNEQMRFQLIDLSGKEIVSVMILQTETVVNLKYHNIVPGFYLYQIYQDRTPVKSGKLVILK